MVLGSSRAEDASQLKLDELAKANPSFCLYPYVQLSTIPSGFVRPCCYYTEFLELEGDKGRRMNVSRHSLSSMWNSAELKRIRREMEAGQNLIGCQQCYLEDRVGTTSLRLRSFKEWGHHPGVKQAVLESMHQEGEIQEPIRYLELKPGNLCNLKCRMCNQFDSSKVVTEMKELAAKYNLPHILRQARLLDEQRVEADFDISQMPDWSQLDNFWKEAEALLPHLETISLAGGEPMILENVSRFLQKAVETGHSRHIKVFLASNFTHFRDNFFEIASNFELFEFIASVDGFGATQEYIRFPSQWSVVDSNFRKAKAKSVPNRLKALTNITIQMLNIMTFTELLDWHDELELAFPPYHQHPYFLNLLTHPRYLSIEILPPQARKVAIERIQSHRAQSIILKKFPEMNERLDLIRATLERPVPFDYEDRLREFVKSQAVLDEHRGQSLEKFNPELFTIINEELKTVFATDWSTVVGEVVL
jgi:organic radical activating enzyme